jgi:glycosyltransferase involved in cell wall biosynthesis
MKLAIVTHNVLRGDGQGRVLYELTSHALKQGCEVMLVADRVDQAVIDAGAQWTPVHPIVGRPLLLKVWDFARRADRLVPALQDRGYLVVGNGFTLRRPHDVSIAHMVHAAWTATARLAGPVSPWRRWYQDLYTRKNVVWEKQAYDAAKRVIAVSSQIRQSLLDIGLPADRVDVVLNGVDIEEFHPGTEDRSALSLPTDVPLAIFVGDLRSPRKNLQTMLKTLPGLPGVHLAVIGGLEGSPFPALAAELGLSDRVHFLGRRTDVARLMRASDFCLFPSYSDAFGLVILEAMASGLPVLASSTAGASELVSEACGRVIAPDDEQAWKRAMADLAANPSRRRSMGIAARAIAENHSFTHMAGQYLELFGRIGGRR